MREMAHSNVHRGEGRTQDLYAPHIARSTAWHTLFQLLSYVSTATFLLSPPTHTLKRGLHEQGVRTIHVIQR
jgi:hypothetical protein